MSQLLTLEQTSKLIKFPKAVSYHLGHSTGFESNDFDGSADLGITSLDGSIAAIAKGCNLDVLNLETNERLAAWTFTSQSGDQEPEVSSLLVVAEDKLTSRSSLVLVGINSGADGGQLCLFDIPQSKPIRCISLPFPVTSLALVSSVGGPSAAGYFHPSLRYFHGIVAVGMAQGHLYLLDLALDENVTSTDLSPAGLVFIDPLSRDLARHRRDAVSRQNHVALDLTCDIRGQVFIWEQVSSGSFSSPSSRKEIQFSVDDVKITSLHYTGFNASLAVGFNLGTWRLISLQTLQIDHSSVYVRSDKPVTQISFQEPENDPRNYVYYWIVRSEQEDDTDSLAVATLYSLTYRNKQLEFVGDEELPLYTDLESLVIRFEHILGGEDEPNCSWCIGMYTLELRPGYSSHDTSETDHSKDYGLNVIIWKAGTKPSTAATYLGVFDINAWYQAQMPGSFSVDESDELCSYFSHSLLEDPLGTSGGILDVTVFRDTVTRFNGSGPVLEQHCYPSSLKFDLVVVTRDGFLTASHLGIQRRVLNELACRPSSLVQPSQLYQICLMAGLAQGNMMEPSLLTQRELLLNIALEYNMVGLIVGAVRDWSDGKYSKAGCTLKFMLDWAWKRVAAIKERLDLSTMPLFDLSIVEADEGSRQLLTKLSGQLAQLVSILSAVGAASGIVTQIGLEQLECRKNVTGLVLLYTQAVTWFVNMGLLPEQPEGRSNPYPVQFLIDSYREKRRKLGQLPRTYGKPDLLVDLLCEDIGDDLIRCFQKSGGAGDYPPPNLHALLSIFLSDTPAPAKLRLVQYIFLDLAQILDPQLWSDLVDNLIKFPSAFSLPPSIIKLTQAFWLLDHEDWEESVSMMLDPLLQEDDLSPEHHRAILTALLAQGQFALALKYSRIRRPPVLSELDVQLQISVLLQNGAIQEAYTFQRSRQGSQGRPELLQQFYQKAEQLNKLDSVLKLSLSFQEEEQLVRFLQESKKPHSKEALLMYYLQRSRYTDAMQLNEKLKNIGGGQKAAAREAIMDRYSSILPSLAKGYKTLATKTNVPRSRPEPVQVVPNNMNMSLMSRARNIEDALGTPKHNLPSQTPFRNRGGRRVDIGLLGERTDPVKRKLSEYPTLSYPSSNSTIEECETTRNDLISPPSKRTRMSDISSLTMSTKTQRRLSRFMTADALTILETPVIVKRSMRRTGTPEDSRRDAHTPQSILKVKKLIQENSPALDQETSPSDSYLPGRHSREGTPGKSIRFKVPKKIPPPDFSVPMPTGEAETTIFSPSLVSPRAELATSSDLEISFQVPVRRVDDSRFNRMKVRSISESSKMSSEGNDSFHSIVEENPIPITSPPLSTKMDDVMEKGKAKLQETLERILEKETGREAPDDSQDIDAPADDAVEVVDDEVDPEADLDEDKDSDDLYYENRSFERKECDLEVESEDESPKKVELSFDMDAPRMGDRTMNDMIEKLIEEELPKMEKRDLDRKEKEKIETETRRRSMWPSMYDDASEEKEEETPDHEVVEEPQQILASPLEAVSFRMSVSSEDISLLDPVTPGPDAKILPTEAVSFRMSVSSDDISLLSPVTPGPDAKILPTETTFNMSASAEDESILDSEPEPVSQNKLSTDLGVVDENASVQEDSLLNISSVEEEEKRLDELLDGLDQEVEKKPGSALSFSYDSVTTDVEKFSGVVQTGFLDIPEQEEPFEIISDTEVDSIRQDELGIDEPRPDDFTEDSDECKNDEDGARVDMRALLEVKDAEKKDSMRDLLDDISTTATRASSVCGSMWSESQHDTSYIFAEAEVISDKPEEVADVDQVFKMSAPLDTSQMIDDMEVDEPMEKTEDKNEDEPVSDEEDEDEEEPVKLNFSWTAVPRPEKSALMVLQEEIEKELLFSVPHTESEGSDIEPDNQETTFNFAQPLDVSMHLEEEDEENMENLTTIAPVVIEEKADNETEQAKSIDSDLPFSLSDSDDEEEENNCEKELEKVDIDETEIITPIEVSAAPIATDSSVVEKEEEMHQDRTENLETREVSVGKDKDVNIETVKTAQDETNDVETMDTETVQSEDEVDKNVASEKETQQKLSSNSDEEMIPEIGITYEDNDFENKKEDSKVEDIIKDGDDILDKEPNDKLELVLEPDQTEEESLAGEASSSPRHKSPVVESVELVGVRRTRKSATPVVKSIIELKQTPSTPLTPSIRKGKSSQLSVHSEVKSTPTKRGRPRAVPLDLDVSSTPSRRGRTRQASIEVESSPVRQGKARLVPPEPEAVSSPARIRRSQVPTMEVELTPSGKPSKQDEPETGSISSRKRRPSLVIPGTVSEISEIQEKDEEDSKVESTPKRRGRPPKTSQFSNTPVELTKIQTSDRKTKSTRGETTPSPAKPDSTPGPEITPRRFARSVSTPVNTPIITPSKLKKRTPSLIMTKSTTLITPVKSLRNTPVLSEDTPLTPTRRSRRISGILEESGSLGGRLVTAPDGGVIIDSTRRGSGTPRSTRRHTAVKKEDIEVALGISPVSLAPVLEDQEDHDDQEDQLDQDEQHEVEPEPTKPPGRNKRRSTLNNVTSLKAIEEEPGHSTSGSGSSVDKSAATTSKRLNKLPDPEVATPDQGSARQLRRRTIITLGEADGLMFFSPLAPTEEEKVEPQKKVDKQTKKYGLKNNRKSRRIR